MSTSQLLLVSLGPIQDFIASARRCHDLWFGSWLLSDLARATAESLQAGGNATLIFPGALGNDKVNVANKVLATVAGTSEVAASAAQVAEQAMRRRLIEVADEAFAGIEKEPLFRAEVARRQLDDLIEFHWVSVPLGAAADYATARACAEESLAALKNSRCWGPVSWTDGQRGVPKSSLDGLRESVVDEQLYQDVASGRASPEKLRRDFGVRGMERLCGVGLLKRLGAELSPTDGGRRRPPSFHSTSHLAAAPLLTAMTRVQGAAEAFEVYRGVLRAEGLDLERFAVRPGAQARSTFVNPFDDTSLEAPRVFPSGLDGHLLYEMRLEEAFEECTSVAASDSLAERSERLRRARSALGKLLGQIGRPPAYYALLLADGDSMGATIDSLAREGGQEAHTALSRALDEFAVGAAKTVADHGGSLIYSGGDDVLALLPLHGALACARALHDDFGAAIRASTERLQAGAPAPTLSVGLAIVHHLESFGEARGWAKKAEQAAKAYRGTGDAPPKDALAVVLVPRSGAETTVVDAWRHGPDKTLLKWVRLLGTGAISSKAAHDLLSALQPLEVGLSTSSTVDLREVVISLSRRVLSAKRERGGGRSLGDDLRQSIETRLRSAAAPFAEVERIASELLVAQALLEGAWAAFGHPDDDQRLMRPTTSPGATP